MNYKTFNEKLENYRILIWNANADEIIFPRLAPYTYNAEKMDAGKALWTDTDALGKKQTKEQNEQYAATEKFNDALDLAQQKLKKAKKLARIAFEDNSAAWKQLNLNTLGLTRFEDWLDDSEKFYANLLANNDWMALMGTYSYTPEIVSADQQETISLKSLQEAKQLETGDAQQATNEKWEKFNELKKWCSHLSEIAKIEFESDPQILEKLGILVRS